jgi:hypothetical protein
MSDKVITPSGVNRNHQEVIRATGLRSSDSDEYLYVLRCGLCRREYCTKESSIDARLCPACQGGATGECVSDRFLGLLQQFFGFLTTDFGWARLSEERFGPFSGCVAYRSPAGEDFEIALDYRGEFSASFTHGGERLGVETILRHYGHADAAEGFRRIDSALEGLAEFAATLRANLAPWLNDHVSSWGAVKEYAKISREVEDECSRVGAISPEKARHMRSVYEAWQRNDWAAFAELVQPALWESAPFAGALDYAHRRNAGRPV